MDLCTYTNAVRCQEFQLTLMENVRTQEVISLTFLGLKEKAKNLGVPYHIAIGKGYFFEKFNS